MIMSKYIKPEMKYLSVMHESSLLAGTEESLYPDEEFEEGANQDRMFEEEGQPAPKSVWE
jgi:hypothetical protein